MNNELIRGPHRAALHFEPAQLSRAREIRGLTKTALAQAIDKTPSAITQFEGGASRPDAETLARLALYLGFPVGFFARKPLTRPIDLEACNFRSLRSVSQYQRRQAIRIGELVHELASVLAQEGVIFPPEILSQAKADTAIVGADDIEKLAVAVRQSWGLGLGPIPHPFRHLESRGVRILPLAGACEGVDAFSFWHEQTPYLLLAMRKTASRAHFDAAHELGHLLMHEDVSPANPDVERQADHFASAFLMPRETFFRECPRRWDLPVFKELKARWRVSIRALLYRAHKLGALSTASYRRACIDLNRRYGAHAEPGEWALDRPQVLLQALELVRGELPLAYLAERLALSAPHLRELIALLRMDQQDDDGDEVAAL